MFIEFAFSKYYKFSSVKGRDRFFMQLSYSSKTRLFKVGAENVFERR